MNKSSLEVQNGKTVVYIEGAAVIDTISDIYQIIQEAMNNQLPLILDLKNVTECDSSFVQLIRSLCYTLNNGGHAPLQFAQDTWPESLI